MKTFNVKVRLANAAYQGTVLAASFNAALMLVRDRFDDQDLVITVFPSRGKLDE